MRVPFKKDFWLAFSFGPLFMLAFILLDIFVGLNFTSNLNTFWQIISLVLIYPVFEEALFRGIIQGYIRDKIKTGFQHISYANLLTSVLFSLTHLITRNPVNAVLVFLPSLVFGYFRDKTNSITASIILHVSYNFFFYLATIV